MKTAIVTIQSISPYSASRRLDVPRLNEEPHDKYEERVWREKAYYNEQGFWYIPKTAFLQSLQSAAGQIIDKVPGKGSKQWTSYFMAGVIVENDLVLSINKEKVQGIWLLCNPQGRRGGSSQVRRRFPIVDQWGGDLVYRILDDMITQEIFEKVLRRALELVGVGRFRGENGGLNGRAIIKKIKWQK